MENKQKEKNQKHVFWQALVLAVIVFSIGIFIGYAIERNRADKIGTSYLQSEQELLDVKILTEAYNLPDINKLNCNSSIQKNIEFGDKIYSEAKVLDNYEDANRFSDAIDYQHKRYDLLRTLFWLNSLKLKEVCNANFHTIVYFYDYKDPTIDQQAEQNVISVLLGEVKAEKGNKVLLIPIAGDTELFSISLMMENYNISLLPTILIDEKTRIGSPKSKEEILSLFN